LKKKQEKYKNKIESIEEERNLTRDELKNNQKKVNRLEDALNIKEEQCEHLCKLK
jgi:chromosome segregation ATPase